MDYKMASGSRFSREWRRNKKYSAKELRMLCRRRGCSLEDRRGTLSVVRDGKVVVQFSPIQDKPKAVLDGDAAAPFSETLRAFAALGLRG